MTPGPYFQYWSSIIDLYVEVKFSADHSTQLLSPWFPGSLSCLGVCILPGQREALEVSVTLKRCFMHPQGKVCSQPLSPQLQDSAAWTDSTEQLKPSVAMLLACRDCAAHQSSRALI